MDWREQIERIPGVLGGKPKVKGTRLSVELILARLGEGWSVEQLIEAFPHLKAEQIQACMAFAAESLATDDVVDVPRPAA